MDNVLFLLISLRQTTINGHERRERVREGQRTGLYRHGSGSGVVGGKEGPSQAHRGISQEGKGNQAKGASVVTRERVEVGLLPAQMRSAVLQSDVSYASTMIRVASSKQQGLE